MFVTIIILGTVQVWKHFCVKRPVSKWNDKLKQESTDIIEVGWELHTLLSIVKKMLLASTIQILSHYIILREEFLSSIILIPLLIYISNVEVVPFFVILYHISLLLSVFIPYEFLLVESTLYIKNAWHVRLVRQAIWGKIYLQFVIYFQTVTKSINFKDVNFFALKIMDCSEN
jgi:hypothetical protein